MGTELETKLKKQIEFYFSDSNYPNDRFLKSKASENEGFVPISVIASFTRLKSLTEDVALITKVIEASDQLVLSEDKLSLKRKYPVPDPKEVLERTVFVKGFPANEKATPVTIESVEDFFKPLGKVRSVRLLRNNKTKSFQGKAFVEFDDKETATKITEMKDLKWPGEEELLIITPKHEETANPEKKKPSKKRKRDQPTEEQKKKELEGTILVLPKYGRYPIPALKEEFNKHGEVKYVDVRQPSYIYVRYANGETASKALAYYQEHPFTSSTVKFMERHPPNQASEKDPTTDTPTENPEKTEPKTESEKTGPETASADGATEITFLKPYILSGEEQDKYMQAQFQGNRMSNTKRRKIFKNNH